jgi:hypothetical protein
MMLFPLQAIVLNSVAGMKPLVSVPATCSAARRLRSQQCRQRINHFHDDLIPCLRVLEVTIRLWFFELLEIAPPPR